MKANAMTEEYEHVELLGVQALFTDSRLDRSTAPRGWHCYDLRGRDDAPSIPATLEERVSVNHAGTVLSPEPFEFEEGMDCIPIEDKLDFLDETLSIRQFCELHGLEAPKQKYTPVPASPEEAGLFYAQTPEQDNNGVPARAQRSGWSFRLQAETEQSEVSSDAGCIGHVRIDFGRSGKEFWHTWHPRGSEELNSPEFKAELDEVVGQLRESVLKDLPSMRSYCHANGGAIAGGICTQNYGYTVETERYRYLLRCNPIEGDYQAYLSCFDKQAQELAQRAVQCNTEQLNFPDGWCEGDTCYLITNKAKRYAQPYTVESFDGAYFGVRGRTGLYYRVSPGRMFRTREDAVASLKAREPRQEGQLVGRVTFANGEQLEYTDPAEYLRTVREELPYHSTSGFRFETLTDDPAVRKAVDDMICDLYGEENPRRLEEYEEQPEQGMTMGGM